MEDSKFSSLALSSGGRGSISTVSFYARMKFHMPASLRASYAPA